MRKMILGLLSALGLTLAAPAFAQPPAVPALPDTERRTSYSISGTTCACSVNFALFNDSTDVDQQIEVWVAGTRYLSTDPTFGWSLSSVTGPLATIPRPITDAVLTFNAVQTGTIQIVGAQRPRRLSQFAENRGVAARDLNQALTGIIATERETWDRINGLTGRVLQGLPGENITVMPSAANRASKFLVFDGSGNPTVTSPTPGLGNVIGPGSSTNNGLVLWNGTAGTQLKDFGSLGTTTTVLHGNAAGVPSYASVTGSDMSANTVGNAQLAQMTANTVKCNPTAGLANAQDCAISSLTAAGLANVSGSGTTTTGTISASSNSLALAAAINFANGQGIRVNHAGAAFALAQPTAPTATPTGAAGGTTYQYKLSTLNGTGGVGTATSSFQTTTGNATLSATNYNALSWTPAGGSPAGYAVYKSITGTFTLIGVTTGTTFNDYGYTSWPYTDWIPATAPASALADYLVTTISSGAGTTTLTLGATATTLATTQTVTHDDTVALQAALTASGNVSIPNGTYYTTNSLTMQANANVTGVPWLTQFKGVNIGQTLFNLASQDKISGLQFFLLPGQNAISTNTVVIEDISTIRCLSATNGLGGNSNCLNVFNVSYLWANNIFMDSWAGVTGFGTGGAPPTITVSGTVGGGNSNAINLNRITMTNDGNQVSNGNAITFDDTYNSSLSHSYLNANLTSLSTNWSGVGIKGPGQVIDIVDLQTLNFANNIRLDSTGAGSSLTTNIMNSHFDFCGQFCILLQDGAWVQISGNSFVGEAIAGAVAIHASGTFLNGPNVISGNTFNGFSGAGANPITFSGTMLSTNIFGNQYANNGANANITGNGALILEGSASGGHANFTGSGTAPTNSACAGFTLAAGSSDNAGRITYTNATTCTFNFGTAYTTAPFCQVTPGSAASTVLAVPSTTQLAVTFGTAQTIFAYNCFGK